MELITSESSSPALAAASGEAASATPAPPAESTPAADATQPTGTETGQPAQEPTRSDEPSTGSQDELPDDAAFQALPGEARASNWAKARARIGEQNQRIEQLSSLESFKPMAESIDQRGGWESVEPLLDLASNLFTPVVDEDGQPMVDPQSGLPQYTAAPFVDRLADQSIDTVKEIILRAFDIPFDEETLGHWLFRERLGLDPGLLATYQQIQSPDQAREHITQSGGIDPALYEGVATEYHDVLKSLMNTRPGLRAVWASLDDDARSELLEDHRHVLESREYMREQRQRDEQAKQEREAAAKRRIEETGMRAMAETQQRVVDAQLAKLKQTATFFADEADNADVWDDIISRSAQDVLTAPELKKKSDEWQAWHMQLAAFEAAGDRLKASRAKVEIGNIERKLEKEFADRVAARTGLWSRRLGGARAVHQQQIQDAQPRIEITAGGDNSNGTQSPAYSPPPPGQRFGLSDERKIQIANELKARRQAQGG